MKKWKSKIAMARDGVTYMQADANEFFVWTRMATVRDTEAMLFAGAPSRYGTLNFL
jgi:hypothetical protein